VADEDEKPWASPYRRGPLLKPAAATWVDFNFLSQDLVKLDFFAIGPAYGEKLYPVDAGDRETSFVCLAH
jgi:hypothetical protein